MRYSVQPRDLIFAKNMGQNNGKKISKIVSGKYSQKFLYHAKQSETDAFRTTSIRAIKRAAEATVDLIGNKIAIRKIKV